MDVSCRARRTPPSLNEEGEYRFLRLGYSAPGFEVGDLPLQRSGGSVRCFKPPFGFDRPRIEGTIGSNLAGGIGELTLDDRRGA
jgi:hypothetical protein